MSDDSVIVFDGACVLCSRWTRFVLRVDRHGTFRLAAMQTEAGRRLLAALLRVVPASWRDVVYRVIARNRYRWFGRKEVCVMPGPEQRARFIE